ncbi:MAG: aminoacyl-tRNA hydrolase [Alphaproteobacteria bacterium]|nr:aminoacyl-tRNA hydrolase [Alphaproteobacteria bacterium]
MLLLVGLGNPGPESANHRHNAGAMAIDAIAARHGFGHFRSRFHGKTATGTLDGEQIIALKPETFMNASGEAVAAAVRFYKLSLDDVLVVHDDIDLAPGKIKVKQGGGDGGHNGLRSIDSHLGPDYRRLRIGVGHPGHKDEVADYVLKNFSKAEQAWLDPLIAAIAKEADLLVTDEARFLTRVALLLAPPKPKAPSDEGERGV